MAVSRVSLAPGFRFGSYEIVGQRGVGGMGEVYRALDTQLKRDVAIKILPSADKDRGETRLLFGSTKRLR